MKRVASKKRQKPERREVHSSGGTKLRLFLLLLFGVGSYFFGERVVPAVGSFLSGQQDQVVIHTAEFPAEEDTVAVAGSLPEYEDQAQVGEADKRTEDKPKAIKSSTGSVFSEGDPPLIVGEVPAGWRVETSNEIKAKFGPQKVPVGDDITFVVPVYTLVPSESIDGVYIIEPGRTKTGDDEGGTLSAILSRLDGEIAAISTALGSLSEALAMLPSPEIEEGAGDRPVAGGDKDGISYRTSVSGR